MRDISIVLNNFIFSYKEYKEMDTFQLKKHIHPFYELLFIVDGQVDYVIENRFYTLKAGDLLLINPAQYHWVRAIKAQPYKRFCFNFLPSAVDDVEYLTALYQKGELFSLPNGSALERLLWVLKDLSNDATTKKTDKFFYHYLNVALFSLQDLESLEMNKTASSLSLQTQKENNFQKVINFINANLTAIYKIDDIANALFFSGSYVNHLFKKELGFGVMQYVRDKKVLLAHQKILEGKKPTDIVYECGFTNYITFFRSYCRYFGFPPSKTK